jgi:D-alanyl-lipoteichoic acid acyltransferase DltB (MBOAT superfamily)
MLFNSGSFFCFLLLVLLGYWLLPANFLRKILLVGASLLFYGWWDWRFLGLLGFVILSVFFGARLVLLERRKGNRRRALIYLWCCLGVELAVLGFFKYFNFFEANLLLALQSLGVHANAAGPTIRILLPIGISFYTFHAITLAVDTFRGTVDRKVSLLDVALYIAFFPQLVAGPIVRATVFLPQIEKKQTLDGNDLFIAVQSIGLGFLYKVVFADAVAPFVDSVFRAPAQLSWVYLLAGGLGFYCQIYFDFNGYSLIAIGVSRLFGYRLPDNFNFPYCATSLTAFWHRWHISLSTWLRDYLYIPLGGNRGSLSKQLRNLMCTMLLGGLWHGASWNFVLWGGTHGAILCAEKLIQGGRSRKEYREFALSIGLGFGWVVTQAIVFLLWIPFRASNFQDTVNFIAGIFSLRSGTSAVEQQAGMIPWLLLLLPVFCDTFVVRSLRAWREKPALNPELAFAILVLATLCVALLAKTGLRPFIYFQF